MKFIIKPVNISVTSKILYVCILKYIFVYCLYNTYIGLGPRCEKTCLWGFSNNKDTDQPAHPHRLISAFVISFLESIKSRLATSKISIL